MHVLNVSFVFNKRNAPLADRYEIMIQQIYNARNAESMLREGSWPLLRPLVCHISALACRHPRTRAHTVQPQPAPRHSSTRRGDTTHARRPACVRPRRAPYRVLYRTWLRLRIAARTWAYRWTWLRLRGSARRGWLLWPLIQVAGDDIEGERLWAANDLGDERLAHLAVVDDRLRIRR